MKIDLSKFEPTNLITDNLYYKLPVYKRVEDGSYWFYSPVTNRMIPAVKVKEK